MCIGSISKCCTTCLLVVTFLLCGLTHSKAEKGAGGGISNPFNKLLGLHVKWCNGVKKKKNVGMNVHSSKMIDWHMEGGVVL